MRTWMAIAILVVCAGTGACGGSGDTPAAGGAPGASPAAAPASNLVDEGTLTACAGFSAAKAAEILGVAASEVTDSSRTQGTLRFCSYRKADDPSKTVSFTLGRRDSVAQAVASLQSERDALGGAQGAIDRVTKSPSARPASEGVQGIGDEAFYSSMNGAIMMRVRNVLVQVMGPNDLALKKRVAEEVARGLRR